MSTNQQKKLAIGCGGHVTCSSCLIGSELQQQLLPTDAFYSFMMEQTLESKATKEESKSKQKHLQSKTKGPKFRTLHKFGKRRRKRKQAAEKPESASAGVVCSTRPAQPSTPMPSTSADITETVSAASFRKLGFFKRKHESSDESDFDTETKSKSEEGEGEADIGQEDQDVNMKMIVDLTCLQSLITASGALCPNRQEPNLRVHEGGKGTRKGSAFLLQLHCSVCGELSSGHTSKRSGTIHTGFDVNCQIVAAATANGMGFAQTKRFFALMSMPPPMNEWSWYFLKGKLHAGVKRAADKHLQEAAEQVRATYADTNIGKPDKDGMLDISISIDGSWQKRGRTSHNGIVTVIEIMTGLVVDYIALSNYCQVCQTGPKPDDEEHEAWMENHRSKCQKNIDCSSAAMEMEGAAIMFQRSVQLHSFRYTEMLGDGDSKTYTKLLEIDPYNGILIEKIECINHITKRMGTALRTLVEKRKAQKSPIGGRGKLTENKIKMLTNYYGRAIKDNSGDLEAMQRAVWASFFHSLSSDVTHNHTYCPAGSSSWCFYQRALADNIPPRPHSQALPSNIGEAMKPVFERLGDPQLLRRCLAGKTQNANESFHSLMWRTCPKERWANLRTVDTALSLAIQRFNKGSSSLLDTLLELELLAGTSAEVYAEQEDVSRVQTATRKSSKKQKERRQRIESVQRQERQTRQEREGDVYGAGQF